jgi:LPXTG-site transpeptidase (sortase) family protein
MKTKILATLGIVFLILSAYFVWQRFSPANLAFKTDLRHLTLSKRINQSEPVRLIIPFIDVDLPIYSVTVNVNEWPTTTRGVLYVSGSAIPGQTGNAIFYGHNFQSIFGNLPKIKTGMKINVIMNNGLIHTFTVSYTQIVRPNQIEILSQTSDKRITLYTCIGWFDEKRFVVVGIAD